MKKLINKKIQSFIQDNRGVAYIEFAVCLPFLLLLFAGSVDLTRLILLHQKVEKAVFTVGDLATQLQVEDGVCAIVAGWEDTVVKDILLPFKYSPGEYSFVMSSVLGTSSGGGGGAVRDMIEWRYNPGGQSEIGAYSNPYQQRATLPPTIRGLDQDERVIVTEMNYTFTPIFPVMSTITSQDFRKVSYFRSRVSTGREGRESGVLSGC
ncbi:MAG: pilus assembly protein [Alphaproteobacteria bacterium]|nr:pilus assembly protein [Alphaproteobacteria bacterium]